MGLYERLGVKGHEGFAYFHALIEASKRALAIRDHVVTDFRDLAHDVESFLAPDALAREAAKISMTRAARLPIAFDAGDTVWMGAIDAEGRAVSFIQSVYWEFGSGCVLPRTGVLMQNRGLSFSLDPNAVNPLRPGRRPFHTLNPPICAFDDGRVMAYGSMGGDGQPQFQAQVLTRIRAGQDIAAAVDAPRYLFGRSWGAHSASVKLEIGFDESAAAALARAGHEVEWAPRGDRFGHAGALVRLKNGAVEAAHDPRSDGGAEGF
jgi:gamma-glutamyltranspeptidase/glutathione hydrolase